MRSANIVRDGSFKLAVAVIFATVVVVVLASYMVPYMEQTSNRLLAIVGCLGLWAALAFRNVSRRAPGPVESRRAA